MKERTNRPLTAMHVRGLFAFIFCSGAATAWAGHDRSLGDFDGDGRTDIAVYQPAAGGWNVIRSSDGGGFALNWGYPQAQPVRGDYDGDGRQDFVVYDGWSGNWLMVLSQSGSQVSIPWGWNECDPVSMDRDGDGRSDLAIYHPPTGDWIILRTAPFGVEQVTWGWYGTDPVPADYDGDRKTDLAVFDRAGGIWYIKYTTGVGTSKVAAVSLGGPSTDPVPADYDGDNRADVAVYDRKTGRWIIISSSSGGRSERRWGGARTIPVPGYYDNNANADFAVYYPRNGTWYIRLNPGGSSYKVQWGGLQAMPLQACMFVSDDGAPYGFQFGQDFDEGTFEYYGPYVRPDGTIAGNAPPPPPPPVQTNVPGLAETLDWSKVKKYVEIDEAVGTWAVTKELDDVSIDTSLRILRSKLVGGNWRCTTINGLDTQGNFCVAVEQTDKSVIVGTWAWDACQHETEKGLSPLASLKGDLGLRKNARIWFFLSAPSRGSARTVRERTLAVETKWPFD